MLPRHLLSRATASRLSSKAGNRYLLRSVSSTATVIRPKSTVVAPSSAIPNDTDLREIFDQPYNNHPSASTSLSPPTGLFGNPLLRQPNDFITLAHATIRRARAIVARITDAPNNSTSGELRRVVQNFDRLSDVLCSVIDMAELVRHAHPDSQWVDSANDAYEILCSYMNVLNTHTGLYDVLKIVMSDKHLLANFSPEEMAVALIFQRDFERSGIDLPPFERSQFVSLSSEIITLGRHFVLDGPGARGTIDISAPRLRASLPNGSDILEALEARVSRFTGNVRVQGNTWDAHMLLRYCSDENIRRDIYIASHQANPANVETLEALLRARAKLATLVGKASYAEMTLTDKMARTPGHVSQFLNALSAHHRPLAEIEIRRLAKLKAQSTPSNPVLPAIQHWDKDYYSARFSASFREKSTLSLQRPPVLTLGTVFQALSELFIRVFGLRLRIVDLAPGEAWHPDVHKLEVISILGSGQEEVIGWIFADLFTRSGKQEGAAHFTVRCSRRLDRDDWIRDHSYDQPEEYNDEALLFGDGNSATTSTTMGPTPKRGRDGIYQLPIAVLSCDFVRPGLKAGASMLGWHEIEVLFHEMGHALHSMLGQTEYHNVAGTRCATDFVELPSILMEHFLASTEVQSLLLSRPLSSSFPLSRTRGHTPANDGHAQILLASLDQAYHAPLAPDFSSTTTYAALHSSLGVIPYAPSTAPQMQFGHLYSYGATYYSYLFDQAIASRVFKQVFADDPLDRSRGERYVNEVLKWGGGKDPWVMVGRLLEDEKIQAGDGSAMETVGRWGIDANTISITQ